MRVNHNSVVPAKAGTQKAPGLVTPEDHPNASEQESGESDNPVHPIHPDSDEEPVDLVAMAKEIVANLDPSEFEDDPPTTYKPDYSMWEIIERQPQPVITEEQARIGASRFREAIQRQRLWDQSDVKIPIRKDYDNYDDS